MDFLFEFLFQVLFEIVAEVLVELGFRGAAKAVPSRIGRAVLATSAGFAFGLWWGDRLSDTSLVHRPRLLWISLAVTVLAIVQGAAVRGGPDRDRDAPRWRQVLDPRVWPGERLLTFALLNAGIAAGIAIGFDPVLR
jgi:hypothetical protein